VSPREVLCLIEFGHVIHAMCTESVGIHVDGGAHSPDKQSQALAASSVLTELF